MATLSPNDILILHNIDVDCHDSQIEYRRKIVSAIDEDGNHTSDSQDIPYGFDHSIGFQTMYEGQVFAIRPGETRRLPRYVGEKFAKELIDHLLTKKSIATKDENIVNDVNERTLLLDKIIISEELLNQDDGFGEAVGQDNMDIPDNTRDSKVLKEEEVEVSDQLRGFEVTKVETPTLEQIKSAPDESVQDGTVQRSRKEMMTELKVLGLPFKVTDTNQDLLNKLKAF